MAKRLDLSRYMPEAAVPLAQELRERHEFQLKITKKRVTKFGDYRAPYEKQPFHKITLNHDLNPYAFLITFVHEVAHLRVWEQHKGRVQPHGQEWKREFQKLLLPFFAVDIFPKDIERALAAYIKNPAASTCSDDHLYRTLRQYNEHRPQLLEELPAGGKFRIHNGKVFQKGEQKRKRFICTEVGTSRKYLIHPLMEVEAVA